MEFSMIGQEKGDLLIKHWFFVAANCGYFTVFTPHIYFIILINIIAGNLVEIRLPKIQSRKCLRKSRGGKLILCSTNFISSIPIFRTSRFLDQCTFGQFFNPCLGDPLQDVSFCIIWTVLFSLGLKQFSSLSY
jgi:hypothetical protein